MLLYGCSVFIHTLTTVLPCHRYCHTWWDIFVFLSHHYGQKFKSRRTDDFDDDSWYGRCPDPLQDGLVKSLFVHYPKSRGSHWRKRRLECRWSMQNWDERPPDWIWRTRSYWSWHWVSTSDGDTGNQDNLFQFWTVFQYPRVGQKKVVYLSSMCESRLQGFQHWASVWKLQRLWSLD